MITAVRGFVQRQMEQANTMAVKHPIISGIAIIILFYALDVYATENAGNINDGIYAAIMVIMLVAFYAVYVVSTLKSETITPGKKKSRITAFTVLSIISFIVAFFYDPVIGTILPTLYAKYNQSQILLWILITPVFEELVFRYLLYDKWALTRFKKPFAMLLILIIFVVLHPVTDAQSFMMHLLPALLLFVTYDLGGIYASLTVHILFNTLSLL